MLPLHYSPECCLPVPRVLPVGGARIGSRSALVEPFQVYPPARDESMAAALAALAGPVQGLGGHGDGGRGGRVDVDVALREGHFNSLGLEYIMNA